MLFLVFQGHTQSCWPLVHPASGCYLQEVVARLVASRKRTYVEGSARDITSHPTGPGGSQGPGFSELPEPSPRAKILGISPTMSGRNHRSTFGMAPRTGVKDWTQRGGWKCLPPSWEGKTWVSIVSTVAHQSYRFGHAQPEGLHNFQNAGEAGTLVLGRLIALHLLRLDPKACLLYTSRCV